MQGLKAVVVVLVGLERLGLVARAAFLLALAHHRLMPEQGNPFLRSRTILS
jgi:hypothetical protein